MEPNQVQGDAKPVLSTRTILSAHESQETQILAVISLVTYCVILETS